MELPIPKLPFFKLFIAWTIFVMALMGGLIYVAVHFIAKFW